MSEGISERAATWIYRGVWAGIVRWLRVPAGPPRLPGGPADRVEYLRPAPGFLKYLKFWFWLLLLPMDLAIAIGWIAVLVASPLAGAFLLVPALVLAIAPDILVYIGIQLR